MKLSFFFSFKSLKNDKRELMRNMALERKSPDRFFDCLSNSIKVSLKFVIVVESYIL